MNRNEIQAAVAQLLSLTVGRKVTEQESIARESEPTWDSLKHVQLVVLLEEEFDVRFTEAEMATLDDSDKIVRAIEQKNAA